MPMRALVACAAIVSVCVAAGTAGAKPARCYTTDDGEYDCDFVTTDDFGSFEITAPGMPSFGLVIEEPGVGLGFGDYGSGSRPLPGRFFRSEEDPACWENDETGTEICAW